MIGGLPGKDRREQIIKAVERNKEAVAGQNFVNVYKDEISEDRWVRDSNFDHFARDLVGTVPKKFLSTDRTNWQKPNLVSPLSTEGSHRDRDSKIFLNYILQTLPVGKREMTAVELGGPGGRLFKGFPEGVFRRTLGVCLNDIRTPAQRKAEYEYDNHLVAEANILDIETDTLETKIKEELGEGRTDLIISRMMGPLGHIEKDSAILDRVIRKWYKILKPGGLMFIQFIYNKNLVKDPDVIKNINLWKEKVEQEFPEIEVELDKDMGAIRILKKEGAPDELPPATQLFSKETV